MIFFKLKMHRKPYARTRWGSFQCFPDLVANLKVGRRKGGSEERREGRCEERGDKD